MDDVEIKKKDFKTLEIDKYYKLDLCKLEDLSKLDTFQLEKLNQINIYELESNMDKLKSIRKYQLELLGEINVYSLKFLMNCFGPLVALVSCFTILVITLIVKLNSLGII